MKITLLKKLVTETGKTLSKGFTFEVTNDYAGELIKKGIAVEFGQKPILNEETNLNKTEE